MKLSISCSPKGLKRKSYTKILNKIESSHVFGEMSVLNKAMNLCYFELLGDAAMVNEELLKYSKITKEQVIEYGKKILVPNNSGVLYYKAKV